ncbi:hypothetical protein E2562_001636 [Oryza meyeriana var. granulata]|uniref:Uncharacterized protein n=1 Tax=Oryza meyeriana var. granulata TaxID=110450 RepID=A0A6G1CDU6_9ORYZ|nr:hypothetical protein E2562_001636 [Oryza meyeriana var. granulata]
MAQPGKKQRRQRGGLLAALLLSALLLSLCLLARVDASAAVSAANLEWKEEGAVATALGQARLPKAAMAVEEGDRPERVEMEAINDYVPFGANNRHNPHP